MGVVVTTLKWNRLVAIETEETYLPEGTGICITGEGRRCTGDVDGSV
jgi:hypothetical protein